MKPLDVDFHLNCEETETGSALAVAQWSIRLKNHTFNWSVELSANTNVTEAIRFLTDIQKRLIDDARTFEAVHK